MKIILCAGSSCTMMGANTILDQIEDIEENLNNFNYDIDKDFELEIETVNCLGLCKKERKTSPVVIIDGDVIQKATPQVVMEKILDAAFKNKFDDEEI